MKRYKFRTYLVLTLLWLAMVLLQACLPGEASYAESNGVLALAHVVFPWLTHAVLRRAAHLIEYFLLGFFMTGTFCHARKFTLFKPMFFCLLTALCDETVKIFIAGRVAQISDIWLDFAGAMAGILLMWLISAIKRR